MILNTKKETKKHKRAIAILQLMDKKEKQIEDITAKMNIEDTKSYTEQYLTKPKKFYEQLLKDKIIDINWLEKRYTQMITSWDEELLRNKLNIITNE